MQLELLLVKSMYALLLGSMRLLKGINESRPLQLTFRIYINVAIIQIVRIARLRDMKNLGGKYSLPFNKNQFRATNCEV